MDRAEQRRVRGLGTSDVTETQRRETGALGGLVEPLAKRLEARAPWPCHDVRPRHGRKRRQYEIAHRRRSSSGERYESASARCSASTRSPPARAAIVRATRATRARPRPESGRRSTARSSSSAEAGVRRSGGPVETPARAHHSVPHRRRRLRRRRGQLGSPRTGHRDDQVEAIEQCARQLLPVGSEPLTRACAFECRIAPRAARTEVHRGDELEAGRKQAVAADAGHRDDSVLERLTQRLQRRPRELRKLVEKQDAAVREAGFPGAWAGAAADDRRRRRTVVRRSKGRHRQERAVGWQETGDGMDPGHFERVRS